MIATTVVPPVAPEIALTMTLEEAQRLWLLSYKAETGVYPRIHTVLSEELRKNGVTTIEGSSVR